MILENSFKAFHPKKKLNYAISKQPTPLKRKRQNYAYTLNEKKKTPN